MIKDSDVILVRETLRRFNRLAGVLKTDPYGLGLSLSQASALVDIDRAGALRPQVLVDLLNLEKSSVSRLVAILEEKGLVKISADSSDRRGKVLSLTQAGKKAVKRINSVSDEIVHGTLAKLNPRQRQRFIEAFEYFLNVLDSKPASERDMSSEAVERR